MPQVKKYTERIDIPLPPGTKARARKIADSKGYDTVVPFLRRILLKGLADAEKRK